jgi:PAS domain S-box-containing protein
MSEPQRYKAFFDSLAAPVFFIAPDGTIEDANLAAQALVRDPDPAGHAGLASRERGLFGQAVGAVFPWLGELVRDNLRDPALTAGCETLVTDRIGRKTYRAVLNGQPDVSGAFMGLSLILQDETERQTVHDQIVRAKEELERTFDTISDLVFLVDNNNVLRRVNKALATRLGQSPREIVGRRCQEVLGCDQCVCLSDDFAMNSTPVHFNNVPGRYLLSRNVLADPGGETFGFVLVARDVAPLEHMQDTLRKIEDRYKSIFDNAREGIFQSTPDGRLLNLNPAMAEIFGFASPQEMRAAYEDLAIQMYVRPQDRQRLVAEALRTGHIQSQEMQLKRKDGSAFWAALCGRAVQDSHGDILYLEGFLQDVNERKMLESQLLQTQKLEAIGQLAAGIAHEINTPAQYVLNNVWFIKDAVEKIAQALQGHGRLLEELAVHPHLAGDIERLQAADKELQLDFFLAELPAAIAETVQGLDRITAIVRSVKQFAHPGHAQAQPANPNDLVRDTVNVSRNEWKYVADLTTDLDPDLPPVPCLVHEIGQVLLNLIINAAHAVADKNVHGSDRGVIAVSTRLVGDWVEIRIQDSGTGIPEHARDHVFEPFFTTKAVGKGTGQGLYLAHRTVVAQHGGRLNFETESGRGTTFVVALPVAGVAGDNTHGL